MKAGSELGSLGSRASSQFWGLLASLSSPTPILTVLTSNTLQPMWTTDPVRTDFSLPWNAPSPFLSLCFHTAPKVPSLPFSAYPNPTYSAKSNQVPPLPAGFPGCLRFYFIHLVLYQSESAYNKLGLNFISFLFPQYIYPFNKKIFKTQKIPLKDWILVLRLSVQLWQLLKDCSPGKLGPAFQHSPADGPGPHGRVTNSSHRVRGKGEWGQEPGSKGMSRTGLSRRGGEGLRWAEATTPSACSIVPLSQIGLHL